jgi:DNA-binding beta-propeller fold protein YncE
MRSIATSLFVLGTGLLLALALSRAAPEPHRSPIDLAVLPGAQRALTANHTADSVSLIDLREGKVVAEVRCGRKPSAVTCSRDGRRAAVSNLWSGSITLLEINRAAVGSVGEVVAGALPRGLAFTPDGASLYAAISGADEVVRIDWSTRKIVRRWPAPREPRHLALSPDGRWLAAAASRSGRVYCWDTQKEKLHWERPIEDAFNLRGLAFTPDGQAVVCAHVVHRAFPVSRENIEQGWVIDSRLTYLPIDAAAQPPLRQIALDTRGAAVGDPHGVAFTADGRHLAVTGSGTHELLLLDADAVPWSGGDPGDFLDPALRAGEHRLRRVALGGRPLAVAAVEPGRVAIANYLLDAVQIVDAASGKVVRTIPLGSPAHSSPARRGEALFYDAERSHDHWFSCHTCHVDGHTCGLTFDTLNDDSYGNPKLTPSLQGVTKTGPWTWHGWQKDLGAGVKKSLTETMFGPEPTADEIQAMLAFLGTLDHPPNPNPTGAASRRGEALFRGNAHCVRCHKGEQYTSEGVYDVKLEPDGSPYRLWNPPSLRGVWDRGPFLHDGRAKTLDEVLRKDHAPEKLGGEALTDEERHELLAFLKTL